MSNDVGDKTAYIAGGPDVIEHEFADMTCPPFTVLGRSFRYGTLPIQSKNRR